MNIDNYQHSGASHLDMPRLRGRLVVIEGPDSSGRSTHVKMLTKWLEEQGYAVVGTGIKRSMLVAQDLDKAKSGNILSARTMSLFYATDFYDQMENVLVPALRAGMIVLADRYFFTLMARDMVRGADAKWLESLYSRALTPNQIFFLKVPVNKLVVRALKSNQELDYWESGMDTGFSRDWFNCFMHYQQLIDEAFLRLSDQYRFTMIDATRDKEEVQKEIRKRVSSLLSAKQK